MATQIIIVLFLTYIINLITTLSYAVRIVGVRTGRIAVSFALFNILVLVSRTANGFQAPLLAKTIEDDIKLGIPGNEGPFRLIILSCTLATITGAFLIPTFQRALSKLSLTSVHTSLCHDSFYTCSQKLESFICVIILQCPQKATSHNYDPITHSLLRYFC
jgi:hypothetical protein